MVTRYTHESDEPSDGDRPPPSTIPQGSITIPPISISQLVATNESRGIVRRADATEPTDHIIAESTQSRIPPVVAPPLGRRSTATPANPTATPISARGRSRSRPHRRNSTTQSGTEAIRSDARPVGTFFSAKNSTAFAPGSRQPTSAQPA